MPKVLTTLRQFIQGALSWTKSVTAATQLYKLNHNSPQNQLDTLSTAPRSSPQALCSQGSLSSRVGDTSGINGKLGEGPVHWSKALSFPFQHSAPQLRSDSSFTDSMCGTNLPVQLLLPIHKDIGKTMVLLCKAKQRHLDDR